MSVFPSYRRSWFSFSRPSLSTMTWWIAFACAVLGLLGGLNVLSIPILAGNLFWIVLAGLILLLATTR